MLTAMPCCFTGIEKTPAIKYSPSSKSDVKLSPEQELLQHAEPQIAAQWAAGKPFIVTAGRLTFAYSPSAEAATLSKGDTLRYDGMYPVVRLSGDSVTEVRLLTPAGRQVSTVIESPLSAIIDKPLPLPFTVDAELVGAVRDLLKGKTVWTLRPDNRGKRYQKTQIADVLPGTSDFPFLVAMPTDSLLLVLNSRSTSARTFDNLFSLSDPRKSYPQISDRNWELICNGKIAVDMTRDECRLALGAPAEIDRETTYSGIIERWTYEDGKYLIFTDGLLTRFRL